MKMNAVTKYPHGTIAWTELFAGDVDRQKEFYGTLFGWSFDERGRARSKATGKLVAGLRKGGDAFRGWAPFVAADDPIAGRPASRIDESEARTDPHGARFFAWDGTFLDGEHGLNAEGGLAWNELWTPDVAATIAFYREAFGWNLKEQPGFAGAPYLMFAGRDRPTWTHAGIRSLTKGSARWMSYFEVKSCAESVEDARRFGAEITLLSTHVDGVGFIATASDREGTWFGLMQSGA
jgi:predicted enzyme related to lactoylglutathione lyase